MNCVVLKGGINHRRLKDVVYRELKGVDRMPLSVFAKIYDLCTQVRHGSLVIDNSAERTTMQMGHKRIIKYVPPPDESSSSSSSSSSEDD